MVHFNHLANIKSELIQMNSNIERNQLLQTLPTSADGGTSICSGIKAAFQVKIPLHMYFDLSFVFRTKYNSTVLTCLLILA
jgi:calcium-activated chloride channel regulator 4